MTLTSSHFSIGTKISDPLTHPKVATCTLFAHHNSPTMVTITPTPSPYSMSKAMVDTKVRIQIMPSRREWDHAVSKSESWRNIPFRATTMRAANTHCARIITRSSDHYFFYPNIYETLLEWI